MQYGVICAVPVPITVRENRCADWQTILGDVMVFQREREVSTGPAFTLQYVAHPPLDLLRIVGKALIRLYLQLKSVSRTELCLLEMKLASL